MKKVGAEVGMRCFMVAGFVLIILLSVLAVWSYDNERFMVILFLVKNRSSVVVQPTSSQSHSHSFAISISPDSTHQISGGSQNPSSKTSSVEDSMAFDQIQERNKDNVTVQIINNNKTADAADDRDPVSDQVFETHASEGNDNTAVSEETVNKTNVSKETLKKETGFGDAVADKEYMEKKKTEECDIFTGKWVYDESYVLGADDDDCPFSSKDFKCRVNGRPEFKFERWRWQPQHCDLPRFNASEVLVKLRGKRLMYVGDSIARNQWEAMLCFLRSVVPQNGGKLTATYGGATIAYVIQSCNCSVELSWAPFMVQQRSFMEANKTRETLQLDTIDEKSADWKNANILVFNSGHWWVHPEPLSGDNFYEEGGKIHAHMDQPIALEKALNTWASWVESTIDPAKTQVFFRSYSPVHFNGQMWGKKVGGGCFNETEPIEDLDVEESKRNPDMQRVWPIARAIQNIKSIKVKFLNITWMSLHRKDAHNSVYRGNPNMKNDYSQADCSHWCIPGLPDVWNHLLYALI